METIVAKSNRSKVSKAKKILLSAGNTMGSVHFRKRSDNTLRKMCYRLHVRKPSYAPKPSKNSKKYKKDREHNLITVFDANKVRYNNKGNMCGRGEYRSIPLDTITRICVKGTIYRFV